jgi:arginyl-tRNA--protein-N-Asp/Glu arginylyltransferase
VTGQSQAAEHERRVSLIGRRVGEMRLPAGPPHPCAYRPGREAREVAMRLDVLPAGYYHAFMDLNYRRLGEVLYRPACEGCSSCAQLRVPVEAFRPSRSQRRCLARNADISVTLGPPAASEEKRSLYARYLDARHDTTMDGSWEEFASFLYTSCVTTLEATFRQGDKLLAVSIVDAEPDALSAVYCYFDPDLGARSLGTFNILWLIAEARRSRRPYVYLGYYVAESPAMRYKAGFRPCEIWSDGTWHSA